MTTPRVLFFGTPSFAVPFCEWLQRHTQLLAVVTAPAKPAGRGLHLRASPVARVASAHNIPVLSPTTLNSATAEGQAFHKTVASYNSDITIVIAYGRRIPASLFPLSRRGFINVHPSLLPRHRGPSPIPAAILNGDTETGVTIMQLDEGIDTGPLYAQTTIPLSPFETCGTLEARIQNCGVQLLAETLPAILNETLVPLPQDATRATMTHRITSTNTMIDWSQPAERIDHQIRALSPTPGAVTICHGRRVIIRHAHLGASGTLEVLTVQPEGKTAMSYAAFRHGYPDCPLPPIAAV